MAGELGGVPSNEAFWLVHNTVRDSQAASTGDDSSKMRSLRAITDEIEILTRRKVTLEGELDVSRLRRERAAQTIDEAMETMAKLKSRLGYSSQLPQDLSMSILREVANPNPNPNHSPNRCSCPARLGPRVGVGLLPRAKSSINW